MICFCSIEDGQAKIVEGELSKSLLENNKCYILDRGNEVFVWVGRVTQLEERKAAGQKVEVEAYHFLLYIVKKKKKEGWIFILNSIFRNFLLTKIGLNQQG